MNDEILDDLEHEKEFFNKNTLSLISSLWFLWGLWLNYVGINEMHYYYYGQFEPQNQGLLGLFEMPTSPPFYFCFKEMTLGIFSFMIARSIAQSAKNLVDLSFVFIGVHVLFFLLESYDQGLFFLILLIILFFSVKKLWQLSLVYLIVLFLYILAYRLTYRSLSGLGYDFSSNFHLIGCTLLLMNFVLCYTKDKLFYAKSIALKYKLLLFLGCLPSILPMIINYLIYFLS